MEDLATLDQPTGWVVFGVVLVLAVLIGGWTLQAARRLHRMRTAQPVADLTPYEIAVLGRGHRAAILAAVVFLHTGGDPAAAPPLVSAVAGSSGRRLDSLTSESAVTAAIRKINTGLTNGGYLSSRWIRGGCSVAGTLAAGAGYLGVVLPFGPTHPLFLLVYTPLLVFALFGFRTPERSSHRLLPAGQLLSELRDITPRATSAGWPADPTAAAMSVALEGIPAVWTADPALAKRLALPPTVPGIEPAILRRGCGDDYADHYQTPD